MSEGGQIFLPDLPVGQSQASDRLSPQPGLAGSQIQPKGSWFQAEHCLPCPRDWSLSNSTLVVEQTQEQNHCSQKQHSSAGVLKKNEWLILILLLSENGNIGSVVGVGWGEVCRFQHSNGPESRHCLISSWSSIFTQGVTGKIVPGITHKTLIYMTCSIWGQWMYVMML